jgi:murein DD-endopeptidase MepM/ murein hydrolase activator NlpD
MESSNTYAYPVDKKKITLLVDETSSGSHDGPYKGSIDMAVPVGTVVKAAADGVVARVHDDSDKHGDTIDFGHDANYITIEHANNELSEYMHLAKDSAKVKVGDKVKAGQPIAKTGLSGWMFAPHLHFMVYKKPTQPDDFKCLKIKFA